MGFIDNVKKVVHTTVDEKRLGQTEYRVQQMQNTQQPVQGFVTAIAGTTITVNIGGFERTAYATNKQVRIGSQVTVFGDRVF